MANRLGNTRALPPKLDEEEGPVHSVLRTSNMPDSPPIVFCIIQWNLTNKRPSEVRWHLIWVAGNQWKRVSWREGNLSWADNLRWMCRGYLRCQFSQRGAELHFSGWKSKSTQTWEIMRYLTGSLFSSLEISSFLTEWALERQRRGKKKENDKRENKADIKGNLLSKLARRAALI